MTRIRSAIGVVVLTGAISIAPAVAQQTDQVVADDLVSDDHPTEQVTTDGFQWSVSPGLSLSFNDNRNVVGQPDGYAFTMDAHVPAALRYRTGANEIRSALNLAAAFSRTAALSEFIKSGDQFKFEAEYLFHALEWLGPYARFSLETTMFEGYDTRAADTTWVIARLDGTPRIATGRHLLLTEPFQPLTFREGVGAFAAPYASPGFSIEARVGFGGLETLADGQYAVADDGATPEVEVRELQSFNQAAVEFGLQIWGSFFEDRILYKVVSDVAVPVVNDPEPAEGLTVGDLTNFELSATLGFKLLSWMSLDYSLKVLRRPQLIDEFQITNNLLLTISYTLSSETTGGD